MLGFAVESRRLSFFNTEAKFSGNDYFVAHGLKCFADPCLARIRTINLSRIEERAAFVEGAANKRNHVLLFKLAAIVTDHREATQTDRGNFQR